MTTFTTTNTLNLINYENNWSEVRVNPQDFDFPSQGSSGSIVLVSDSDHFYNGKGFKNNTDSTQNIQIPINTNNTPGKWFKIESRTTGDVALFVRVGTTLGWTRNDETELERLTEFGNSTLGITLAPGAILWSARIKAIDVGIPSILYESSQSSDFFKIKTWLKTGARDIGGGRGHYFIEISKRSDFRDYDLIDMSTMNEIALFFEEKYNMNSSEVPTTVIDNTRKILTKKFAGIEDFSPIGTNIGDANWVTTIGLDSIDTLQDFYFRIYVIDGNWE